MAKYGWTRNEDVEEEKTRQAGRYPERKGGITYYQVRARRGFALGMERRRRRRGEERMGKT